MVSPVRRHVLWRRKQTINKQSHQQMNEAISERNPCNEENVRETGLGWPGRRAGETHQVATGLPKQKPVGKKKKPTLRIRSLE